MRSAKDCIPCLLGLLLTLYSCADEDPAGPGGETGPGTVRDDTLSTDEDVVLAIDVVEQLLANDAPAGGGAVPELQSFEATTQEAGSVVEPEPGQLLYTPALDFHGVDTFHYTVSIGGQGPVQVTVTITVQEVNDPPVAAEDLLATPEDTPLAFDVAAELLANDADPVEDDPLFLASFEPVSAEGGTIVQTLAGFLTYTPPADFHGEDHFGYQVGDGRGGTGPGRVRVTVTPVNDSPSAGDDQFTTPESRPLRFTTADLLANDRDPDGAEELVVERVATASAQGGSVVDERAAGVAVGSFLYTPPAGFAGEDSFSYSLTDGQRGVPVTARVTVLVTASNAAPVAVDDTLAPDEDTARVISTAELLANDRDADLGDGLSLHSFGRRSAAGGTVLDERTVGQRDGTLRYSPPADFHGQDAFSYTVMDERGGLSAPATVTITVVPVNDAPVARDDELTMDEDGILVLDKTVLALLLANDSDVDVDEGLVVMEVKANAATVGVVAERDGAYVYSPPPDFQGTDTLDYSISDGLASAQAKVFVHVLPVADPPLVVNDLLTTPEDVALTVPVATLLANDGPGGSRSFSLQHLQARAAKGGIVLDGRGLGEQDGSITYIPAANFYGEDSFGYQVVNSEGETASGLVTVLVTPVDDPPQTTEDHFDGAEDEALGLSAEELLLNDREVDLEDELAVVAADSRSLQGGSVALSADGGTLTYLPPRDFQGDDRFVVIVSDGQSGVPSTVWLHVRGANDAPVVQDDELSGAEDVPLEIHTAELTANDHDVDLGDSFWVATVDPGTTAGGSLVDTRRPEERQGRLVYTPPADFHGEDVFGYTLVDASGAPSGRGLVHLRIASRNDPPVAVDDELTTEEDTALVLDAGRRAALLANDSDPDGEGLAALSLVDIRTTPGTRGKIRPEGESFVYEPAPDWHGLELLAYTVADAEGATAVGWILLSVTAVNDPPLARPDRLLAQEDTPLPIAPGTLLANDLDPVEHDDLHVVELVATPQTVGAVSPAAGGFLYTAPVNFHGEDQLAYTIADAQGGLATGAVTVAVASVNDGPIATDDRLERGVDPLADEVDLEIAVAALLANDVDPDGAEVAAPVLVAVDATSAHGGKIIDRRGPGAALGTLVYEPRHNFHGTDSFEYWIEDEGGLRASATVFVEVAAVCPEQDNPRLVLDPGKCRSGESECVAVDHLSVRQALEANMESVLQRFDSLGYLDAFGLTERLDYVVRRLLRLDPRDGMKAPEPPPTFKLFVGSGTRLVEKFQETLPDWYDPIFVPENLVPDEGAPWSVTFDVPPSVTCDFFRWVRDREIFGGKGDDGTRAVVEEEEDCPPGLPVRVRVWAPAARAEGGSSSTDLYADVLVGEVGEQVTPLSLRVYPDELTLMLDLAALRVSIEKAARFFTIPDLPEVMQGDVHLSVLMKPLAPTGAGVPRTSVTLELAVREAIAARFTYQEQLGSEPLIFETAQACPAVRLQSDQVLEAASLGVALRRTAGSLPARALELVDGHGCEDCERERRNVEQQCAANRDICIQQGIDPWICEEDFRRCTESFWCANELGDRCLRVKTCDDEPCDETVSCYLIDPEGEVNDCHTPAPGALRLQLAGVTGRLAHDKSLERRHQLSLIGLGLGGAPLTLRYDDGGAARDLLTLELDSLVAGVEGDDQVDLDLLRLGEWRALDGEGDNPEKRMVARRRLVADWLLTVSPALRVGMAATFRNLWYTEAQLGSFLRGSKELMRWIWSRYSVLRASDSQEAAATFVVHGFGYEEVRYWDRDERWWPWEDLVTDRESSSLGLWQQTEELTLLSNLVEITLDDDRCLVPHTEGGTPSEIFRDWDLGICLFDPDELPGD